MRLVWVCQDCAGQEIWDVPEGEVEQTLEWWREVSKDYLCADCEMDTRMERLDGGYGLD